MRHVPDPNPNIGAMLLDISRPDGVPARTAVLLASIDNAMHRISACARQKMEPARVGLIALEELGKIVDARHALAKSMGLA